MDYDWQDNYQSSETSELYRDKENSSLRQKMGRKTLDDIGTNSMICGLFMSTTFEVVVNLGKDNLQNSQAIRGQPDRTTACI